MDLEKEYLELNLFKEIDSILQKIEQDQQNKNKIIQKPKSDQIEKNKVTHNDDYKIEKDQDIMFWPRFIKHFFCLIYNSFLMHH